MILMSVDLPEPFSPTRQWISPAAMARSTSASAWTPPKRFEMLREARAGLGPRRLRVAAGSGRRSGCRAPGRPARSWIRGPGRSARRSSSLLIAGFVPGTTLFAASTLALPRPLHLEAALDRLLLEHQLGHRHHRIAGVDRVPEEAFADQSCMISGFACDGTTVPTIAIFFCRCFSRTTLPAPIGPFEPKARMPCSFG